MCKCIFKKGDEKCQSDIENCLKQAVLELSLSGQLRKVVLSLTCALFVAPGTVPAHVPLPLKEALCEIHDQLSFWRFVELAHCLRNCVIKG